MVAGTPVPLVPFSPFPLLSNKAKRLERKAEEEGNAIILVSSFTARELTRLVNGEM